MTTRPCMHVEFQAVGPLHGGSEVTHGRSTRGHVQAATAAPASIEAEMAGLDEREKLGKAIERELKMSREEVRTLLHENAVLRGEKAALLNQWHEAERSLGWTLVQAAASIRARLFRENTLRGRCWTLFSRFIKTAGKSGIRAAVRASLSKIARNVDAAHPTAITARHRRSWLACASPKVPVDRFQDLPWRCLGEDPARSIRETRLLQVAPGRAFRRSHRARRSVSSGSPRNSRRFPTWNSGSCSSMAESSRIRSRGSPRRWRSKS